MAIRKLLTTVVAALGILIVATPTLAAHHPMHRNSWQCNAMDKMRRVYTSQHFVSRNAAMNNANRQCHRLSRFPNTCRTSPKFCRQVSQMKRWRCVATVRGNMKRRFVGLSPSASTARYEALRQCRKMSSRPNRCFIQQCVVMGSGKQPRRM